MAIEDVIRDLIEDVIRDLNIMKTCWEDGGLTRKDGWIGFCLMSIIVILLLSVIYGH